MQQNCNANDWRDFNPLSATGIFKTPPYLPLFMHIVYAVCQADLRILAIFIPMYEINVIEENYWYNITYSFL